MVVVVEEVEVTGLFKNNTAENKSTRIIVFFSVGSKTARFPHTKVPAPQTRSILTTIVASQAVRYSQT